jgi:hypothetical protein
MHPAEKLWSRHHPSTPYPDGVIGVPEPIPGVAFFPGGFGLWRPDLFQPLPPFPVGGVMVLGHDFHSEKGYHVSLNRGHEAATQPTWRNLTVLLRNAHIPLERCFFTNVYMGLRRGEATTGPFPGATDPVFVAHCSSFLQEQLRAQLPTLILTLGINAAPMLGSLADDLVDWTRGRGLKHLDAVGPVRHGVAFNGVSGLRATVVALTHPSLRAASVRHRRYRGESGDRAEMLMLQDAIDQSPTYVRAEAGGQ